MDTKKIDYNLMLIGLFSFFLFSLNIGGISIFSLDEAKNASCAREMLESKNFIVPTFNYELRTDKPPLHYYFMMLSYLIFGVSEFSARFFSSVFGSLTVMITYFFAKKIFSTKTAILSAIVLISSLHFVFQFHMAVPDPYLIFFINLAFFSFYLFYKFKEEKYLWIFYVALGFGMLAKGIVALVLPFFIIFAFLFSAEKSISAIKSLKLHKGLILTALISLPWYVLVSIETNFQWTKEFFLKHNISRFTDSMEGHGGIFLITILFVLIGMLPFSTFTYQSVKETLKNRLNPDYLYLGLIVLIYTGFFSISKTKLPNYTVPVYPAFAILLSLTLLKIRNYLFSLIFYLIFTASLPFVLYITLKNDKNLYLLANYSFYFLILAVGGLFALIYFKDIKKVVLSLFTSSVAMSITLYTVILPEIDKYSSVRIILNYIEKDRPVGYYKRYNPAFSFYLKKKIIPLNSKQDVENFIKSGRVYILTRDEYLEELKDIKDIKVIIQKKDLFENSVSVLISN